MGKINNFLASWKNLNAAKPSSRARLQKVLQTSERKISRIVRVSVANQSMETYIKLQTPSQLGLVNGIFFSSHGNGHLNLTINKPNIARALSKNIERNWLIHIEPPGYIRKLGLDSPKLLERFSRVYTSSEDLYSRGGKFIASPPYVHWHLAANSHIGTSPQLLSYDFDFLKNQPPPPKTTNLVAINSNLNNLPGHKLRADFIIKLCEIKLDFNLFGGSGWARFGQYQGSAGDGKWPVFSPSKYALVIENEVAPYYWSEKFSDAILCYSMPIYFGCPNIGDFFPQGSYIEIDITKSSAIDDLINILQSDYYERNLPNLLAARTLIMNKLNLFAFISNEINLTLP